MTGVILTGGASRRMGQPKAWLEVGGRSCIARVRDACLEAGLAVEFQGALPGVREAFPAHDLHLDPEPGQGPLAALVAALARHPGAAVLLLACDLPFASPALLRGVARAVVDADWAAPTVGGRAHPLCGAYAPTVLAPARALVAAGRRDMQALLRAPELRGRTLVPDPSWGDPDVLLLNVNTPEDLQRARHLAAG